MTDLLTGTVTFLFTDVEGSTKLLQELGDDYSRLQDDHMRLMRGAIAEGAGIELRTEGDAFFAVFPSASGAVRAKEALRLGGALWRFWYGRGYLDEGRRWLEAALAPPSASRRGAARAKALTAFGGLTYWEGDFEASNGAYVETLEILRDLADEHGMVEALFNVAMTKAVMGEGEVTGLLLMESLGRARALGDRRGEGWALWGLSVGSMFGGDLDRAVELNDQSVRVFEESETTAGASRTRLRARPLWRRCAVIPRQRAKGCSRPSTPGKTRGTRSVIASNLRFLAIAEIKSGRPERAAKLAGVAAALREKVGGEIPDAFFPFEDPRDSAAKLLDPDTLERLWSEGRSMSVDEALAYAREEP